MHCPLTNDLHVEFCRGCPLATSAHSDCGWECCERVARHPGNYDARRSRSGADQYACNAAAADSAARLSSRSSRAIACRQAGAYRRHQAMSAFRSLWIASGHWPFMSAWPLLQCAAGTVSPTVPCSRASPLLQGFRTLPTSLADARAAGPRLVRSRSRCRRSGSPCRPLSRN